MGSLYIQALLAIASLACPAVGVAFNGPRATPATGHDKGLEGQSPRPTPGPGSVEIMERELMDPRTCGWQGGHVGWALTCSPGYHCDFFSPSQGPVGMVGCCTPSPNSKDYTDCAWANGCVAYSEYFASSCGPDCVDNTFIRKCTGLGAPYCISYTYPGVNVKDYGCAKEPTFHWITMETTASNVNKTLSISREFIPQSYLTGWQRTFETSAPKNTTTPADNSGPNIGAIVGGVIGGLVVLGLIIVGALWFIFRYRRPRPQKAPGSGSSSSDAKYAPAEMSDTGVLPEASPYQGQGYFDQGSGTYQQYPKVAAAGLGVSGFAGSPPSQAGSPPYMYGASPPQDGNTLYDPAMPQAHYAPMAEMEGNSKAHEMDVTKVQELDSTSQQSKPLT